MGRACYHNPMDHKKRVITSLAVIVAIIVGGVMIYSFKGTGRFKGFSGRETPVPTPLVVEEQLIIPETKQISGTEGRIVTEGAVDVPLVPTSEGEKVIVQKAVLTVKGSYDLANPEAVTWSGDAKLVFIKSLGAITLEGKSSQWQLAFSSKTKATKGYEIIIQGDKIVSKKEIDSTAVGADLPKNWYDSDGAIKSLQGSPQFASATISSIQFAYDLDSKGWLYALSTSRGVTSIVVR